MNKKHIIIGCSASLLVLTVLLIIGAWLLLDAISGPTQNDITQTQTEGAKIVTAINQYQADHDDLPQELDDLIPTYLSQIPIPAGEFEHWNYSVRNKTTDGKPQRYELSHDWGGFFPFLHPVTWSNGKSWHVDTK